MTTSSCILHPAIQSAFPIRSQLSYQNAEARRRDVEGFRCAREASMLRNQQKNPELSARKIH
jgi:hypothetical protein